MSGFDNLAACGHSLLNSLHGDACTFAGVACTAILDLRESLVEPGTVSDLDVPHQQQRLELLAIIPASAVPAQPIGQALVVASGIYAGTWYARRVEARDAASALVACERGEQWSSTDRGYA